MDLDFAEPQRNTELALGYLMQAVMGTSTVIDGLAVTQQASPNMTVQVGTGSIISYTTVDPGGVAFGPLALDTTNLVKIGLNRVPVTMTALTAPSTAGQSQNWLVEAQFLESDTSPGSAVVLPYYNAANPAIPYTGPSGLGASNNTRRTNTVQLQWKAGTAAATGQQNTPTPDSGWVGVAIVTVASGQATITNANITAYSAAPFVPTKLPQQRKQLTANTTVYVSTFGNDTNNSGLSASSPFLTLQKAWNYIVGTLDLNGFNVTVSIANGTYTGALRALGQPLGLGSGNSILFQGNTGSPSSVVISTTNAYAISVGSQAQLSLAGLKLTATGTDPFAGAAGGITATSASNVALTGAMEFGACSGNHMVVGTGSTIAATSQSYAITGGALTHYNTLGGGGTISMGSCTVTVTGTMTFSSSFASAAAAGYVFTSGTTFNVAGATVTGSRYNAVLNGIINTNLAGPSYFPGSSAGAVGTGGVYQ